MPVNNINFALLTKTTNTVLSVGFLGQNLNSEVLSNLNYSMYLPEMKKTPGSVSSSCIVLTGAKGGNQA